MNFEFINTKCSVQHFWMNTQLSITNEQDRSKNMAAINEKTLTNAELSRK